MTAKPTLKAYKVLTAQLESPSDLSFDDDLAVTQFRAFYEVGYLHSSRVSNDVALDVLLEVIDNIKNRLTERKKVLSSV